MGDAFLDPILRRIDSAATRTLARLGKVTAIDATAASLTVDCAGDVITGVRWYSHYTPVVGDLVDVLCVGGSSWRVLGKLSKQLGASNTVIETVIVEPAVAWDGYFAEDVWTWAISPRAGIYGGPPGQGRRWPAGVQEDNAGVWYLPGVAASAAGGTILSARVRMVRWSPNGEQAVLSPEAPLVTPRIWRHVHTSMPSGSPLLVVPDWQPGSVELGGTASWELPSTWLADIVSGSAAGLAVSSDAAAEWTRWASLRLELQVQRSLVS